MTGFVTPLKCGAFFLPSSITYPANTAAKIFMANSVSVWTRADDVGNDILTAACLLFMDFGPVLVSIALERLCTWFFFENGAT